MTKNKFLYAAIAAGAAAAAVGAATLPASSGEAPRPPWIREDGAVDSSSAPAAPPGHGDAVPDDGTLQMRHQ